MSVLTRSEFKVSLANLAHNYRVLKRLTRGRAAAVVKTDAYGLGAQRVVQRLVQEECDAFFVAHALEGAEIRSYAPDADIYVLQGVGEDCAELFWKHHLTPVIANVDMLNLWNELHIDGIKPIVQVETGLNRLGFRSDDIAVLLDNGVGRFSYVLSHLACADDNMHFMNSRQLNAFEMVRQKLNLPATLSASDGVFLGPDFQYDMVRLGAAMYGLNTVKDTTISALKPTVFISAPVLQIASVSEGGYVGYGATFQSKRPSKIAVVSIGYGDGLMRSLSNCGQVRLNNQSAPIIGRISMDNIMCDITDIPNVKIGDMAHILDDVYRADDMAKDAGTIGYEILSSLGKGKRFCRVYED
ncbi:MAG: alanine racemase [Alphaproteobacteria bacterium]|nr:alanine racemase [Alphaproteobacteria bacterium]